MKYRIGFGKAIITPQKPMRLSGYSVPGRISQGTQDELSVKCCVIADQAVQIILMTYDVLGVDARFPQWIAEALGEADITKDHILCAATHTHSGPVGSFSAPSHDYDVDQAYVDFVIERSVMSIREALDQLQLFTFKRVQFPMKAVFSNRHDPNLFVDRRVLAYDVVTEDGARVLVYGFACHPTVLKEDNLLFSTDLMGGIERALPEYDMHLFFNGLAGDSSTRFLRTQSNLSQVNEFGQQVASQLREAFAKKQAQQLNRLTHETFTAEMKFKNMADREFYLSKQAEIQYLFENPALSIAEKRVFETALQGVNFALKHSGAHRTESMTFACHALQLDEVSIASVPCELFSTLFEDVLAKESDMYVITYSNGYYSYVTDRVSFDRDYYESFLSPFAPGEGEKLRDMLIERMTELKRQHAAGEIR